MQWNWKGTQPRSVIDSPRRNVQKHQPCCCPGPRLRLECCCTAWRAGWSATWTFVQTGTGSSSGTPSGRRRPCLADSSWPTPGGAGPSSSLELWTCCSSRRGSGPLTYEPADKSKSPEVKPVWAHLTDHSETFRPFAVAMLLNFCNYFVITWNNRTFSHKPVKN